MQQNHGRYSYDPNQEVWPFEKRSLLTETEKRFYKILKEAIPNYPIYIQVPLSQMMRVKNGYDRHNWNNRVNRMSVDFVVCDHQTHIIAAIELDDPSHDNEKRQADDAKKDKALSSAGIKIIRYRVENMPNHSKISLDVMGKQQERPTNSANDSLVEVNNIRLNEEDIISFKPAKQNTVELTFNKLILIGMAFIVLGFVFSSNSKSNSKYSEQQLMQIAQQLDNDSNRLKEKEKELYLRELNLRIESERQKEKLDQARRIYTSSTPNYNYQQNNANTQHVDITTGSDIKAKSLSSDCKSWINSNIIDPSLDKEKYIKENCS